MYVDRKLTAKAQAEMNMPMWNTVKTPKAGSASVDLQMRRMNFCTAWGVGVESNTRKMSGTGSSTCTARPQAPMMMQGINLRAGVAGYA